MNDVSSIVLRSQSSLPNVQQNIRQGDLLFVRVMKNLGGGNYLASFAGGRFTVKSQSALLAGQTFRARVEIANGKLLLVPQMQGTNSQNAAISVQNFNALSPEVAAFLASMGLEADGVAEHILQFLMQSNSKINPSLMQKVRRLASKYKGREKEAAEAALILEQKGIDSAGAALDELMELLQGTGDRGQAAESGNRQDSGFQEQEGLSCRATAQAPQDSLPTSYFLLPTEEPTVLTAFNSRRQKNSGQENCAWVLLPFDFEIADELPISASASETGAGVLRLYLNLEKNAAQKFIINFKTTSENLFFAVYYNGKKIARLEFSAQGNAFDAAALDECLKELAQSLGEGVEFSAVPFEEFSAFATENLPISAAEGFA